MPKHYFGADDLFSSRIKTYPQYEFYIVPIAGAAKPNIFINQHTNVSGSRNPTRNIKGVPNGFISLYEVNIDRGVTESTRQFVMSGSEKNTFKRLYKHPMVSEYFNPLQTIVRGYTYAQNNQNGKIYSKESPYSGYPMSASLTRKLETPTIINWYSNDNSSLRTNTAINVTASALNNLAKKYTPLSKHFVFKPTGSTTQHRYDTYWGSLYPEQTNAGAASGDNFFLSRNMLDHTINFIFIPSIFYGSSIKKGSVKLNFYITGSLMAQAADIGENGELIELSSSNQSAYSGSTVGIVLYDEGVIMLTASHNLETAGAALNVKYDGTSVIPSSWLYYGIDLNDGVTYEHTAQTASFGLEFKGTSHVNTMTMFCHAKKGELNYSNNPTFKKVSDYQVPEHAVETETQYSFKEKEYGIKNIASSSYAGTAERFEKTTYISKVAIYDDDGNLIAVAHTSKPIKKTEERDLTFKLKLDI